MLWLLQPEPAEVCPSTVLHLLARGFDKHRLIRSRPGRKSDRAQSPFKKFNALRNLRRSELVPVITPGKVKLIRFEIFGVASGQTLVLFAAQAQGQYVCYFLRDCILNSENVREFFVERVRPQRRSVRYVNQTSTHSDAIARFLDVALQYRIDFQLPPSG